MKKTFDNQISEYSDWRAQLSESIQSMSKFLRVNNVTDLRTHHQFETVLGTLADDNLSVAFVAEYSRGKSEMINTYFLAIINVAFCLQVLGAPLCAQLN